MGDIVLNDDNEFSVSLENNTAEEMPETSSSQYIDNMTFFWPVNILKIFPSSVNNTFFSLYVLISSGAVLINILTVYVSFKRSYRLLYKCCLISLACSDIILAATYGLSMTPKFLQPSYDYWPQGEFLCSFLPFLQTMGMLANSMVLCCIAVDRYQMVVRVIKNTWDPSTWICVCCVLFIWGGSAGVAVPMLDHYSYRLAVVVKIKNGTMETLPDFGPLYFCALMNDKSDTNIYFAIIFSLLFLPTFCIFIVLYGVIAKHIWFLRTPQSSSLGSTNTDTSCMTEKKKNESYFKYNTTSRLNDTKIKATAANNKKFNVIGNARINDTKPTTVHTARKVRTFKVILTLMILYFIFRMPTWIYKLVSLNPAVKLESDFWAIVQNILSLLIVVNSIINPFMYCFLSQFLNICGRIPEWIRQKSAAANNFASTKISKFRQPKKLEQQNDVNEDSDNIKANTACAPPAITFLMVPRSPYNVENCNVYKTGSDQTGLDTPMNSRSTATTSNNSSPNFKNKIKDVYLPR